MSDFLKILFSLSLSGTLLILILLLLKRLYKNRFSKCWQYYIWLAAALRLLLPFAPFHTPVSDLFQAAETAVTNSIARTAPEAERTISKTERVSQYTDSGSPLQKNTKTADFPADTAENSLPGTADIQPAGNRANIAGLQTSPSGSPLRDSRSISAITFFAWLLPAVWMFLRRIAAYRRFVRYIRTEGAAVTDNHMLELLRKCKESCGIRRPVELFYHPLPASPVMTGFFHPCVAIPHNRMNDDGLGFIFIHELTHYKRRDLFYKWLIQTVVCVHWFNPFVRLLERETGRACELSCDEAVIRSLDKEAKTAYGNTLLSCSRTNPALTDAASALTMTEGAKQLKERLGAIMNEQKRSRKTTLAAAMIAAGICSGSAMMGVYAAPVNSSTKADQVMEHTPPASLADNSRLPDEILTTYRSLLAFRTDTYQNMTVDSFRENAVFVLDTPQGMELLQKAALEDRIRFRRFTDENAFFLCNTLLPLASGKWKTTVITSAGAERPLRNGQIAELEFNASLKILNPDILISEYEQVYAGLYQTALDFLSAMPEESLADSTVSSTKKLEKEAAKALKKYAETVSRTGNITLTIDRCLYGPQDPAAYRTKTATDTGSSRSAGSLPADTFAAENRTTLSPAETTPAGNTVFAAATSENIPVYVKKILSLKTGDYQSRKLKDFFEYVTLRYEADRSLWKAKNRLARKGCGQLKSRLSDEDYHFLTVTLPCTERESTNPYDRTGNIPPDFGGRYELPYPEHGTRISFEWAVRYHPSDRDLTIGQRDQIIINIMHGMDQFVADTPENADVGSAGYLKKMRSRLNQLILENSGRGLDMTVIQCVSG